MCREIAILTMRCDSLAWLKLGVGLCAIHPGKKITFSANYILHRSSFFDFNLSDFLDDSIKLLIFEAMPLNAQYFILLIYLTI